MRPAVYWLTGLLLGVMAMLPYRGTHEPLMDVALRWHNIPFALVVIVAGTLGALRSRSRSELCMYVGSGLLMLCGMVQLRYFALLLYVKDLFAFAGVISAACLFAAGILILRERPDE